MEDPEIEGEQKQNKSDKGNPDEDTTTLRGSLAVCVVSALDGRERTLRVDDRIHRRPRAATPYLKTSILRVTRC